MSADYRYLQEQSAWELLTGNAVFQFVVDAFQGCYFDLTEFASMKGRSFLVTQETAPQIYRLYRVAAERLDVDPDIPVYIQTDYPLQIKTIGTDGDCAIVLSSACVEEYSQVQMLALFGQALSHIRYGHVRMLNIHRLVDPLLRLIPFVGNAAAELFKTLLLDWRQYALYTADRGAAIAAQSADAVLHNLSAAMGMKLESAGFYATLEQLDEEKQQKDTMSAMGKAVMQIMIDRIAVPFGVWRMQELKKWCASAACQEQFPAVYYGTESEFGLDHTYDAASLYRQALVLEAHNQERFMAMLHAAAHRGLPQAQARLGQYYLMGRGGLPKDLHTGLTWLRSAALTGSADAWFGLGVCFRSGCGSLLPKDEQRAVWMFRLAAAAGHPHANARLADEKPESLQNGITNSALTWFRNSCSDGPCQINTSNPLAGLNVSRDLYIYLWIPFGETILALECDRAPDGRLRSAIALTPIGIYQYGNIGIPFHMTWKSLCRYPMDGLKQGSSVTLRIGQNDFCRFTAGSGQREIGALLLRIKMLLDKNGI